MTDIPEPIDGWIQEIAAQSGGQQFTNVETFGSESDLPSPNPNGNIPLDPEVLWVLDAPESDLPVQISSPIVSTDTTKTLKLTQLSTAGTRQSQREVPDPTSIEYTGSGEPFIGQDDINLIVDSLSLEATNDAVFNVGGNAVIFLSDESAVEAPAPSTMAGRSLVVLGSSFPSDLIVESAALTVQGGSAFRGSVTFNSTENQFLVYNSLISQPVTVNGSLQTLNLENVSGTTNVLDDLAPAPSDIIQNVSGVADKRVTELIAPSSTGTTESPATFVSTVHIEPNGTTTIDLSNTSQLDGREIRFVQTGGSNTPVATFQSGDFLDAAPSDLQNVGDTVTVEYVSSFGPLPVPSNTGWVVV